MHGEVPVTRLVGHAAQVDVGRMKFQGQGAGGRQSKCGAQGTMGQTQHRALRGAQSEA